VDALILAGGEIEAERFPGLDPAVQRKAQIPLLGRPMMEWTAAAVRSCQAVERMVVVGHASLETPGLRELKARVVPEGAGIAANLWAGLEALPGAKRVLALSGDLPLLTRAALDDLAANAPEADAVFPYVERADVLAAFAEREWILARTPEGAVTGCSACLFRSESLQANWKWVEALLEARRKSVLGLAGMIGPGFVLKYLVRRLRVAEVERRMSALLHLDGRGYRTRFPELAMDVDKSSDIALAERALRRRGQTAA
jgi:molybdopterin-guanine dinucleotide biosynthesis protein A